jgi:c-di-AMP phosphodiesterase-like protein
MIAQLPNFTVSFGVASSDQAGQFQQVVALADEALLAAKSGGRDQIVVATGSDRPSVRASVGTAQPTSEFSLATDA